MLPMDLPGVRMLDVTATEEGLLITVEGDSKNGTCPGCGQVSNRIHSTYLRNPWDLPVQGRRVRLLVIARRWWCVSGVCRQATFCERFEFLPPYAHRTQRMTETLRYLILALSSTTAAWLAGVMGIETSPRTLLRTVGHGEGQSPTPRVLGVDDFALARGRTYATLLCDLETKKAIDVLPGRSKKALREWLESHPGIEIIARDRASSYADAANEGAPNAIQVADRFHLVRNVTDALKEVVDRQSWGLPEPAPLPVSPAEPEPVPEPEPAPESTPAKRVTRAERRRAAAADRLRRRYEEVHRLHGLDMPIVQIRQATGLSRTTILKYLNSSEVPKRAQPRRVRSILDPFVDYLAERWRAGCHDTATLYEEIVQQGYTGSTHTLRRLLQPWRAECPPAPPKVRPRSQRADHSRAHRVSWKELRWAVLCPPEHVKGAEAQLLQDFLALHPDLAMAHALVQRFRRILQEHDTAAFAPWLTDAAQSRLAPFERLARTLEADRSAVLAGIELPWSTGPVEGHITRVKFIKRVGYGRAGLSLLRARIIGCA